MPIRQAVSTLVIGGFLTATEDEIDLVTMEWEASRMGTEVRQLQAGQDVELVDSSDT